MRGLVFSEFLEFVENAAGPDMVEDMLDECDLESGGAYTTVGNYDHEEIVKMVVFLNQATGNEVSQMVHDFGRYLFGQLAKSHTSIVGDETKIIDFLEGIESHIHTEVRKLYPDAELPMFETNRLDETHLVMDYSSSRPFADLAHGMIMGASDHFGNSLVVKRTDQPANGSFRTRFEVSL
ncbi:MAG: heme NO-binding domain-containing protein [Pseudomonadota bacterium]